MTTQLSIYNSALRKCGERTIASLSENREPRRVLDSAWDDGLISYCLEQGLWNFALRTVKLEYSPSVEPSFGYSRAFDKPTDHVRTAGLCSDEFFTSPLLRYTDEAGYWFAELDTIYVRYVSDDNAYGNDKSLWPQTFVKFLSTYLAGEVAERITGNRTKADEIKREASKLLIDARSKDAMAEPTRMLPQGSWASARGGRGGRDDRGNRGSLIG